MTVLEAFIENIYLYWGIIIVLLIIDVILTVFCLKRRKRAKIKKDFLEIEQQTEEAKKEEEKPLDSEIMEILKQMEEDSKLKPEEVVKKFEDDQELNAIISYQELLESVKGNQINIEENDNGDIDYVKQLEEELSLIENNNMVEELSSIEIDNNIDEELNTIENPIQEVDTVGMFDEETINPREEIKIENKKEETHMDVIDELDDDKKFVGSEVISPVFGRITDFTNYSINKDNTVEVKQVAGSSPEEELKNNEAFLKALINFRNNL